MAKRMGGLRISRPRTPFGSRLTEFSGRYVDGARPRRIAATGWGDGPKHVPPCGNDECWCSHTSHPSECDPLGCSPF